MTRPATPTGQGSHGPRPAARPLCHRPSHLCFTNIPGGPGGWPPGSATHPVRDKGRTVAPGGAGGLPPAVATPEAAQ